MRGIELIGLFFIPYFRITQPTNERFNQILTLKRTGKKSHTNIADLYIMLADKT